MIGWIAWLCTCVAALFFPMLWFIVIPWFIIACYLAFRSPRRQKFNWLSVHPGKEEDEYYTSAYSENLPGEYAEALLNESKGE